MYASEGTSLFELEELPSGQYRQLKCRINLIQGNKEILFLEHVY